MAIIPAKEEFEPIHPSGFKDIELKELKKYLVEPFKPSHQRREKLLNDFLRFINTLKQTELKLEIWIDGSFATRDPSPNDVDVIVVFDHDGFNSLGTYHYNLISNLAVQRASTKIRFNCDLYMIASNDAESISKWASDFGKAWISKKPKGIFRLYI